MHRVPKSSLSSFTGGWGPGVTSIWGRARNGHRAAPPRHPQWGQGPHPAFFQGSKRHPQPQQLTPTQSAGFAKCFNSAFD